MPETKYTVHVPVSKEDLDRVKAILSGDEDPVPGSVSLGRNETITHTAKFPDGRQMDVKCCHGDPAWTEAVLFNDRGEELCCTEAAEDYEGEWTIGYGGVEYTAIIEPKA